MECPNCKTQLVITPKLPSEQVMYFSIKHEHELLMAKTVHGTMMNAEKLLMQIGKDMGVKVQVFLHSVEQKPKELTFGLLLTTKTPNVQVEGAEGCLQPKAPARTQGSASPSCGD